MNIQTLSPQALAELLKAGSPIDLIDVRTPAEFQELHLAAARNIPLDRLDPAALAPAGAEARPLYLICRSGSRGKQACQKLLDAGHPAVFNIEGGTMACAQAGLPVVRGRAAISLERQVRIAAGLLVLIGSLLAWFVHEAFIALPAFVGAGLVFAGMTDTCGMGMLLAKMPWNQTGPKGGCCAAPEKQS